MNIYFDNAASTKPTKAVADMFTSVLMENYANPSSQSVEGLNAENIIKKSAATIANIINAQSADEIYFTSGGTEGNNWAVFGAAKGYFRSGKHIITTAIEHPAVSMPFKALEDEGYDVQFIGVDKNGCVNIDELKESIRNDTILVSTIYVNNEMGAIQDIEKIGKMVKKINPNTLYHVDAVQAFGKKKIDVKKCCIDMLSASGHKFHAPKGLGIFYMKNGLKVKPLMYGGGHQRGNRPGTENAAGAAALALAAEESYKYIEESTKKVTEIKNYIANSILNEISNTSINGNIDKTSPYVLNVCFKGLRAPVLLNALEEKGFIISAGSACSSKKKIQSGVLSAMGLTDEEIMGSVRISFSRFSTMDEAKALVNTLNEIVPVLRRFNRKR